jgi:hypothetical protein
MGPRDLNFFLDVFSGRIRENPVGSKRISAGQSLAGPSVGAYRPGQDPPDERRLTLRGQFRISPELATLLLVVLLVALARL